MFEFIFDKLIDTAASDQQAFLMMCLGISLALVLLSWQFGKYHSRRAKHYQYLGSDYLGMFQFHRFWVAVSWGLVPFCCFALGLAILAILVWRSG